VDVETYVVDFLVSGAARGTPQRWRAGAEAPSSCPSRSVGPSKSSESVACSLSMRFSASSASLAYSLLVELSESSDSVLRSLSVGISGSADSLARSVSVGVSGTFGSSVKPRTEASN
jgi:hypothetical protein